MSRTVALRGLVSRSIVLAGLLAGCGGGGRQVALGPAPAPATRGTLAGPLCQGQSCTCRTGPDDAGVPEDAARKRFEIRLASANELWVTLPDHVLYKSPERAETCFYVDLAPGEHPLGLRASHRDGVSASLRIRELGTATGSWYDTFELACGQPGVCSFEELDRKRAEYAGVARGLHDPCGSTKVKAVTWDTGRAPDQLYPSELAIQLTLDVYKFAPREPSCVGGSAPPTR